MRFELYRSEFKFHHQKLPLVLCYERPIGKIKSKLEGENNAKRHKYISYLTRQKSQSHMRKPQWFYTADWLVYHTEWDLFHFQELPFLACVKKKIDKKLDKSHP